jgi:hypothetical protein
VYFKHPACEIEREYRFQHVRAMADVESIFMIGSRGHIEFAWRVHDASFALAYRRWSREQRALRLPSGGSPWLV